MLELCSLATIDPQEFYLSVQTVATEAIVLIEEQLGGERSLLGDSLVHFSPYLYNIKNVKSAPLGSLL